MESAMESTHMRIFHHSRSLSTVRLACVLNILLLGWLVEKGKGERNGGSGLTPPSSLNRSLECDAEEILLNHVMVEWV